MRFVETVDKINGLPVGFKEVEYLESTGTQYIDTGIAGSSTLKIEMNGQKSGASFGVYFGAGTGNNRIQAIYLDNYNSARIGDVTNTQLGRDTEKFNIVVDTLNKNVIYNGTTYPFAFQALTNQPKTYIPPTSFIRVSHSSQHLPALITLGPGTI